MYSVRVYAAWGDFVLLDMLYSPCGVNGILFCTNKRERLARENSPATLQRLKI
jgi:hypothetical protein